MKKCYLEISILMVNFIGKCLLLRHCPKSPRPQSDYTTSNEVKESCNFSKSFRLKKIVLQCRLKNKKPVANAIKLLQACIYKSVNIGLFSMTSVAIRIVKFHMLMLVFIFKYQILQLSSISNMNLTILVTTNDV